MWYIYDAKWQCPFKTAPLLVKYLEGRHKPIYHPLSEYDKLLSVKVLCIYICEFQIENGMVCYKDLLN